MATPKEQKKKDREKLVLKKKLAEAAQRLAREKEDKKNQKVAPKAARLFGRVVVPKAGQPVVTPKPRGASRRNDG